MLSADQIASAFPDSDRRHRRVRELAGLLAQLCAAIDLRGRVDAVTALGRWLVVPDRRLPMPTSPAPTTSPPPPAAPPPTGDGHTAPGWRRLQALVLLLERPEIGTAVRMQLGALLADSEGVRLVADAGLPNDRGLLHETADRLFRQILPAPRDDHDLSTLLPRLFPKKSDLLFLQDIPGELFGRLCTALGANAGAGAGAGAATSAPPGGGDPAARSPFGRMQAALLDAWLLIAARVQGLGLSHPIRDRSRVCALPSSPFFVLPRAGDRLLARLSGAAAAADSADFVDLGTAQEEWRQAVKGCREEVAAVLAKLELTGVSLDVVYALEVIDQGLRRMETILPVLTSAPGPERHAAVQRLLIVLTRARLSDNSLRSLAYTNLRLLARKLVERAGATGEHYITTTRREYWQMLASAAGGGLVTLGTAAMKVEVSALFLPLFMEGLLAGSVYAFSFLLIQVLGFTLATKQPSMTAATLAESIGEGTGPQRLNELVTQVARIVRTQLCAAIGNVTTVALAALALDSVYRVQNDIAFLDSEKAEQVIASLHPLRSGTIWYAMLTGIILWASSLVGGWVENFAVYHRLPQAISEHRLGRFLGAARMRWLSEAFARNVSGWGGSIALGMMLGMTPPLGAFFGLPLDVRHVTLASGTLCLALAERGLSALDRPDALAAMAGIAVIFVLNLGTSFFLALTVALRAREVPRRDRWALMSAILRRFAARPLEFVFPPRNSPGSSA